MADPKGTEKSQDLTRVHRDSTLEKRIPHAKWEVQTLVVATANADVVIPHNLKPEKGYQVKIAILDSNAPGVFYRGQKMPTIEYTVWRFTEAGTYIVRLFVDLNATEETTQIEKSGSSGLTVNACGGIPCSDFARLSIANTFTQNQLISKTRPEWQALHAGSTPARFAQFVENVAYLTQNLSYNGTNWNLDDTAEPGLILNLDPESAADPQIGFFYATAGSNPRTIVQLGRWNPVDFLSDTDIRINDKTRPTFSWRASSSSMYNRFIHATANGAGFWTWNLYYDGSNWQRDSTSLGSVLVQTYADATQEIFSIYTAPDASNPASITEKLRFSATADHTLSVGDAAATGDTYFIANGPTGAVAKGFQIKTAGTVSAGIFQYGANQYFDFTGVTYFRKQSDGTVRISLPSDAAGVTFPATQAASSDANTLDDYEEGTFTPAFAFGGLNTGITYATQSGHYTKVGQIVRWSIRLTLTNNGSATGVASITGMPFTAAAPGGGDPDSITVGYTDSFTGLSANNHIGGFLSGTSILLYQLGGTTPAALDQTDILDAFDILCSGTYKATA